VENATQAAARDILVHGMTLAENKGFQIVGSVHDEILTSQRPLKKFNHEALIKCMTNLPEWAEGLPLNASGYTEQRYRK
jgi:DNA polymerase